MALLWAGWCWYFLVSRRIEAAVARGRRRYTAEPGWLWMMR